MAPEARASSLAGPAAAPPGGTAGGGAGATENAASESAILAVLGQYAVMQVVLALSGLVRNKVVALRLGPGAFGEISQIGAVVAVAATLVSFGMSVGLSRNAAKARTLEQRAEQLENANGIVLGLSALAVLALGGLLLSGRLLPMAGLTTSRATEWAAALFLLAIPFEGLKTNYLALLQGILDVKGLAVGRSVGVLLATVFAVPVVWFFGFVGAALQYLILSVLVTALLGWRCRALGYSPLRARLRRSEVILLGSFGLMSMASSFAQVLADTSVRSRLIESFGATANGLVQAPYVLAMSLKTIVLASIGSVSLATIAPKDDPGEISSSVDRLLSVVIPVGTAALALLGLFGSLAMTLLYSKAFIPGAGFFPYVLCADLLLVFVWVIGAPLLAYGDRTIWLALDLVFAGSRWAVALALMPRLSGHAVVVGYLAGVGLHALLNLGVYFFRYRLRLPARHVWRLLGGLALVAGASVLGASARTPVALTLAGLAVLFAYSFHHARSSGLLSGLRRRLGR
ncbi:MAG TPA: oligosaccharide flippase family protein [Anaeromyxobacteraceae bacterium]|jgi:O-antigen/teichoic acid export membrane protein|nr:oligosaccharide flippase family protein [Anaeromyxobacteraceae bacterium]